MFSMVLIEVEVLGDVLSNVVMFLFLEVIIFVLK